jgi:hypothetical protein
MAPTVTLCTDDGDVSLPGVNVICSRCGGEGHIVNPSIDGFTMDDLYEDFGSDADEFIDDYLGGRYDITCDECRGRGIVVEVDETRCDPALLAEFRQQEREVAESYAMQRAEIMMGA